MKKNTIRQFAAAIALTTAVPFASAGPVTIFQDNFDGANRNTVGNGWSEIGDIATSVRVLNQELRLSGQAAGNNGTAFGPDAAVTRTVNAVAYHNVAVSFAWAAIGASEATDFLNFSWKKSSDTDYTTLASYTLGGNKPLKNASFNLGPLANNTSIDLRFWTNVNAADEGAFIDSVKVTAVPEPTSIALMGLALVGMGVAARRKRK